MLRYRSIVVGFSEKPRGRLLLPQPPPRFLKNIRMPQLRRHFLYHLAEKGKRFANNTAFHPSSHNPKVGSSNLPPATKLRNAGILVIPAFFRIISLSDVVVNSRSKPMYSRLFGRREGGTTTRKQTFTLPHRRHPGRADVGCQNSHFINANNQLIKKQCIIYVH